MVNRKVESIWKSEPTIEGAGVHVRRAFGNAQVPRLDPFLLLDDFSSGKPADYLAGFPWHPHRGIETITYMIKGKVEHEDSLGNKGAINSGDVQWMTAGSGIIHQEMPKETPGEMTGFQLWANLPKARKMMEPGYQDVTRSEIPEIDHDGARVKVICGEMGNVKGPAQDIMVQPQFLDVTLAPDENFTHQINKDHRAFAYVIDGSASFDEKSTAGEKNLVLYREGDDVNIKAGSDGSRFLLISGKPINEPIAWYGPIVMNNKSELAQAFEEYNQGTFIKKNPRI